MDINKKDHPELYAAKLRRLKRRVDQIVAESRAAQSLQDLELGQVTAQRQQAGEQSGHSSDDQKERSERLLD